MKSWFPISCLLVLVALGGTAGSEPTQTVPDFKVARIGAHLYYESTGKMSRDVLSKPDFILWNTVIGEGSAEAPSNTTLVVVEISCPKEQINVPEKRKLAVKVTQGKKTLESKTLEFPFVEATGKIHMPMFVYGYNGEPMKVTATITGQKQASTLTRTIDFRGGE